MTQLTQQVESLQSQLAALTLPATPEPTSEGNTSPVRPGRLAIDARQLNTPDVFHGEDKKWRDW